MKKILFISFIAALLFVVFSSCNVQLPDGSVLTISFTDTDMGSGEIGGQLIISGVPEDADVSHLIVYWGSSAAEKAADLNAVAEVETAGSEITVTIEENTLVPESAEYLLAFLKSEAGESETGANTPIIDKGSTVTVALSHSLSSVDTFQLTVSGSDMEDIAETADGTATEITAEVPEGTDRTFTVTASLVPSESSPLVSFTGEKSSDLTAGTAADVSVTIDQIEQTKILIPDGMNNYRIVMIDDMNGGHWKELSGTDLGYTNDSDFQPYDIDIDQSGRIFTANGNFSTGGIVRIDDMNGTNPVEIISSGRIYALAIDRENEKIFYIDDSSDIIHTCDYNGAAGTTFKDLTGDTLRGLALDPAGNVYVAHYSSDAPTGEKVSKYNSSGALVDYYTADLSEPKDTMFMSGSVYIANYNASAGYMVIQIDTALNFVAAYGNNDSDGNEPHDKGEFFGPRVFLAVLNRKITLVDSDNTYGHCIVSMDDMQGSGWSEYGSSGSGEGQFYFFGYC